MSENIDKIGYKPSCFSSSRLLSNFILLLFCSIYLISCPENDSDSVLYLHSEFDPIFDEEEPQFFYSDDVEQD